SCLAALSHDWRVAVWDLAMGRLRYVFAVPRGLFADNAALAFSPDGRLFAFSAGNEAKLWDLASGRELRSWPLAPGLVAHLASHPAGKLLLFRVETRGDSVHPDADHPPRLHPRVCRIRDLFSPSPERPLAEIDAFSRHVFEAVAPLGGAYFVVEGIRL